MLRGVHNSKLRFARRTSVDQVARRKVRTEYMRKDYDALICNAHKHIVDVTAILRTFISHILKLRTLFCHMNIICVLLIIGTKLRTFFAYKTLKTTLRNVSGQKKVRNSVPIIKSTQLMYLWQNKVRSFKICPKKISMQYCCDIDDLHSFCLLELPVRVFNLKIKNLFCGHLKFSRIINNIEF